MSMKAKHFCGFMCADMEREESNHRGFKSASSMEQEFLLQWGNKKRLRCVRVKDPQKLADKSNGVIRRRISSHIDRCLVTPSDKEPSNRFTRYEHEHPLSLFSNTVLSIFEDFSSFVSAFGVLNSSVSI